MQEIDKHAVGRRIREVRREAGLRQWELAQRLGTTQSAIHKYEHGVVPEPRRLLEIARVGRTSVEWILTGRHGEGGGSQRERPSDDAHRIAEAVHRLAGPDRVRLEEAIGVLDAAVGAVGRTADGSAPPESPSDVARLVRTARDVHDAVVAHLVRDGTRRLAD